MYGNRHMLRAATILSAALRAAEMKRVFQTMESPMNCTLANESPQARWLEQLDTATRPVEIAAMVVELAESYAECASARVLWELGAGFDHSSATPQGWLRGLAASGIPQRVPALGAVAFRLCERPRPILLLLTLQPGSDVTALIAELQPLLQLAGRRLGILLGWLEQRTAAPPLEYSERLHRALFTIADLAGCGRELQDVLRDIHAVLRTLMRAERLCVVAHDPQREMARYLYLADAQGARPLPQAGGDVMMTSIARSPIWYLLREGKALFGPAGQLAKQVPGPLLFGEADHSPWIGVPMLRMGEIHGALILQDPQPDLGYSNEDLVLLEFVASHVLNLIKRQEAAPAEIQLQLQAQTLANANHGLQDRIAQRSRALHREVAKNARIQHQLVHEQTHDALTGLPNQRNLHAHMAQALAAEDRVIGSTALLQLNLDRFAGINEGLGHFTGDEVLKQVGARLVDCLGSRAGVVARMAADEFAIFVEQVEGTREALHLARNILLRVGEPMHFAGHELTVSGRMGLVVRAAHDASLEQLLRDADIAVRHVASTDFPRMALFDPAMAREAIEVLELESDLHEAVRKRTFEPHFQPIRRLEDNTIAGYEALIRWTRPGYGLLEPADFLKVARDCRLIETIDWQMFERSFQTFAKQAAPDTFLTFNVSAAHLGSNDFGTRLLALLARARLAPSRVVAEITEEALLENPDHVHALLTRLRESGVNAALDDFGTGYSSLHYLQKLPLCMLKMDRVFVDGLDKPATSSSAKIIAAVINLAGSLGIQVIAEGIETVAQRDILKAMGCPLGQGYLLGRPASTVDSGQENCARRCSERS